MIDPLPISAGSDIVRVLHATLSRPDTQVDGQMTEKIQVLAGFRTDTGQGLSLAAQCPVKQVQVDVI